jgi:hypothetical protein
MRVAFAGTHRAGKTSLLEAVHARVPRYVTVDEPYWLLADEGFEASDPPSVEDFERQLRRSLDEIDASAADTLFDRSPIDLLAYLQAIEEDYEVGAWRGDLRGAMESLDLIVLLTIETPDRIAVPAYEDRRLRQRVDERVRALFLDGAYAFGTEVLEVEGTLEARVAQVMPAFARQVS